MVCLLAEPQENPLILWGSWLLRALLVLISAVKSPPFPEARLHHPSQLAQSLRESHLSLPGPRAARVFVRLLWLLGACFSVI